MGTSNIRAIGFTRYLADIRRIPNLGKEEELELAHKAKQGDKAAAHILITSHLPLVVHVAKSYRKYGCDLEDLVSQGSVALVDCIQDFDPSRARFAVYARLSIRSALLLYVLATFSLVIITPSTHHKRAFFGLLRAQAAVGHNQAFSLSDARIEKMASLLDVPVSTVTSMDVRLRGDMSLNQPVSAGHTEHTEEWQDRLRAEDNPELTTIARLDKQKQRELLLQTVRKLPKTTQDIFWARRQEPPVSYEALSTQYNLSQKQVKRRHEDASKRIREGVTG